MDGQTDSDAYEPTVQYAQVGSINTGGTTRTPLQTIHSSLVTSIKPWHVWQAEHGQTDGHCSNLRSAQSDIFPFPKILWERKRARAYVSQDLVSAHVQGGRARTIFWSVPLPDNNILVSGNPTDPWFFWLFWAKLVFRHIICKRDP